MFDLMFTYKLNTLQIRINNRIRNFIMAIFERTFKNEVIAQGVGIHSGAKATIILKPAAAGTGLIFKRTDITDKDNVIPADYLHIGDTRLCSCFANKDGVSASTAEHLMAALNAFGITNAYIELSGPEIPIMDGSAKDFIELFEKAGIQDLDKPQKALKIKKEVKLSLLGDNTVGYLENPRGLTLKPT